MSERMDLAEAVSWALSCEPNDYLIAFDECGVSAEDDPWCQCGFNDEELGQITYILHLRGMRLDTDDVGLVANMGRHE